MPAVPDGGMPAIYGSCFVVMFLSAVMPWINGEVALLAVAALAGPGRDTLALTLVASTGQMVGKCVLYWMGRGGASTPSPSLQRALQRWRPRVARGGLAVPACLLVSATFGLPPFYATTVLAGALRIGFAKFICLGMCGRVAHFGALLLVPRLFGLA